MSSPETLTLPGAVDLHVHLREPSVNNAETIHSGTRAALFGGYVLVGDMPNNPGHETWSAERVLEKHTIIEQDAYIPVATYAGSQPNSDNIGELAKMAPNCIGLKLYGAPTTGNDKDFSAGDFRSIVEEWHRVAPDKPIMFHSGKENLDEMIGMVAGEFGHHIHICHVNDPQEVRLINEMKHQEDWDITCGVCPHHLFKTSHDVTTQGWFARMQPPLANQIDSEQLFDQLSRGEIDAVETDHAPHTLDSKWKAEDENPNGTHDPQHTTCFGVPGIEFALPLLFYQEKRARISMERIEEVVSKKPAEIFGIHLRKDTTVTWRMGEYRIGDDDVESGSEWTPFVGMLAVGDIVQTKISGLNVVEETEIIMRANRVISQRGDVI